MVSDVTYPPVRTLIVDDEPLARSHLRALLVDDPDIVVTGESGDGRAAVQAIRAESPDLVLLDVQMPELDGFEVVREVGVDRIPAVIFITAYDEHALRAFEAHALDYLMKPVNRDAFARSIARAKAHVRRASGGDMRAPLQQLLAFVQGQRPSAERIAVKVDGTVHFLRVDEIEWADVDGDHVRLHARRKVYQHREPLSHLEQRLPGGKFLRIHRSALVNVDHVREIQPWFQGDFVVILADGTRLTSGRSYREKVREFVERAL